MTLKESLTKLAHPKPPHLSFQYGTAGFRTLASQLDSVVFTVGLLSSLRSKYQKGKTIGIMITASHNPPQDNGIKVIDPLGEMLQQSWESYATQLANANTIDELYDILNNIITTESIDLNVQSNVVIARDSRDSGEALTQSVIDGLTVFNTIYQNFQLLTTPQLHYLVRSINDPLFGKPLETGYYEKLSTAYKNLNKFGKPSITIDAANGIGGPKVLSLFKHLSQNIEFEIINNDYTNPQALNVGSGADHVKTTQSLPKGVDNPITNSLYASFDGDADRIVFYYIDSSKAFQLLDGDKIATLLAIYFQKLITKTSLQNNKIGVVQTAYANGSSTDFLSQNNIPVIIAKTGVKHLHHEALNFDIGIYFEANGHGTVLFSDELINEINSNSSDENIKTLKNFINLINQTVGDAISDLLTVLTVLNHLQWSAQDWNDNYKDLPNKLTKVLVKDRNLFQTTNAERTLTSPIGLQSKIDSLVTNYPKGRSFVRASGTEDAVRVYAEADTRENADELAIKVSKLVEQT